MTEDQTPVNLQRIADALEKLADAADTIAATLVAGAALKATGVNPEAEDGWIKWNGGDCPVPDDTRVDVQLPNGSRVIGGNGHSEDPYWGQTVGPDRFVAYRIHKEPTA
jgi:hypothetical protein